jgi:hypothetical protein
MSKFAIKKRGHAAISEDQVTDPDPVPAFECRFHQIGPDPDLAKKVQIRHVTDF